MDKKIILSLILSITLLFSGCSLMNMDEMRNDASIDEIMAMPEEAGETEKKAESVIDVSEIPEYSDQAYVKVNDGEPFFNEEIRKDTTAFEQYSELDDLGRCGVAFANACQEIMPTEKRGDISEIHPSGWQKNKGWERCHLIGYQLSGENANARNLITGTGYLNRTGMLQFENMVADYIKETDNHVLYRVTPVFEGDNLVASGVEMEAWSVEDNGEGVSFNVFCYNVEPNGTINYSNGDWTLNRDIETAESAYDVYWTDGGEVYHRTSDCPSLARSRHIQSGSIEESGKSRPCKRCY